MHAGKEVEAKSHKHAEQHNPDRKHVQHETMTSDGIHEPGPHLHADGVDEQDQAEFLNEMEHVSFYAEPEMPEEDTDKERTRTAKANSLDLDFSDHEADSGGKRDYYNLLPYRRLCK